MTKDKLIAWLEEIKADAQGRAPKGSLERDVRIIKLTRIIRHLWEANEHYCGSSGIRPVEGAKARAAKQKVLEEIE